MRQYHLNRRHLAPGRSCIPHTLSLSTQHTTAAHLLRAGRASHAPRNVLTRLLGGYATVFGLDFLVRPCSAFPLSRSNSANRLASHCMCRCVLGGGSVRTRRTVSRCCRVVEQRRSTLRISRVMRSSGSSGPGDGASYCVRHYTRRVRPGRRPGSAVVPWCAVNHATCSRGVPFARAGRSRVVNTGTAAIMRRRSSAARWRAPRGEHQPPVGASQGCSLHAPV